MALPLRVAFRIVHVLVRYPVWILRLLAFRLSSPNPATPVVGVHTVFIAKENILFLKEWILYHRYMGIEHFFLYDNSGGDGFFEGAQIPLFERDRSTKYGIPYDDMVALPDAEVADVLAQIQLEIPNVHVVRWQPTDAEGRITYAQVAAHNDALKRFDRYVTETTMTFPDPLWPTSKSLCKVSRMWYVMVGRFISLGRRYEFSEEELFFLHYKLPSSHPEQRGRFEERDTGIPPEWLDELRTSGGEYCGPEWKLSAANPDWKGIMEQNEWRAP